MREIQVEALIEHGAPLALVVREVTRASVLLPKPPDQVHLDHVILVARFERVLTQMLDAVPVGSSPPHLHLPDSREIT